MNKLYYDYLYVFTSSYMTKRENVFGLNNLTVYLTFIIQKTQKIVLIH